MLQIESALNAVLLASHALTSPNDAPLDAIVRAEQRVASSVAGQAREVAARLEGPVRGEWDVRYALAYGIEAFRLPHRLTARFRVNARAGLAAFELDLVPPEAWPRSAFVDGLGVVPATEQMRRRASGTYNARLAALVAGYALDAAPELGEVWVAGVIDTARDHVCLYSARMTRAALEAVDLGGAFDPSRCCAPAGRPSSSTRRAASPPSARASPSTTRPSARASAMTRPSSPRRRSRASWATRSAAGA